MTFDFWHRWIATGLALAFLVVLVRPQLLPAVGRADAPMGYAEAVRRSSPAVANIYTSRWIPDPNERAVARNETDLGSAVVLDASGHVVTNYHLVSGAEDIWVQLADGRVAEPVLVGVDPETDLALLRIDVGNLPTIALGRSDEVQIGDVVLAIGNPYGLAQTVTQGIVSATGRGLLGLSNFEDFIQTDAAINRGNSGGALINSRGELVGINTATLAEEQSTEGISFAIPVNLMLGVVNDLIEHGRVIRGWLGLQPNLTMLRREQFRRRGIQSETDTGILLEQVYENGPGWKAGLRRHDILTHLNDEPIRSRQQALQLVAAVQPGEVVRIRGFRGREAFVTEAIAGERPIAAVR
ncbi:MAG: trypsin-like peptidase domain-containing protein [Pseudomonadota bacterium]